MSNVGYGVLRRAMMRVTTLQIAAGRCAARNPGATALCLSRAARGARRVGQGREQRVATGCIPVASAVGANGQEPRR